MKFLLLSFVIAAASAYPHWDESGQYRVLDEEAIKLVEQPLQIELAKPEELKVIRIESSWDSYHPYYRYYQALSDPTYLSKYYQPLAEPIYTRYYKTLEPYYYANLPAALRYKAYQPFVYDYKLVKDIDA